MPLQFMMRGWRVLMPVGTFPDAQQVALVRVSSCIFPMVTSHALQCPTMSAIVRCRLGCLAALYAVDGLSRFPPLVVISTPVASR
jgi:hypothetical protein